jgi:hypothetical protein
VENSRQRSTVVLLMGGDKFKSIVDLVLGMNLEQLRMAMPVLNLGVASFLQAPETPETIKLLSDKCNRFLNSDMFASRANLMAVEGYPWQRCIHEFCLAPESNAISLFKMFGRLQRRLRLTSWFSFLQR